MCARVKTIQVYTNWTWPAAVIMTIGPGKVCKFCLQSFHNACKYWNTGSRSWKVWLLCSILSKELREPNLTKIRPGIVEILIILYRNVLPNAPIIAHATFPRIRVSWLFSFNFRDICPCLACLIEWIGKITYQWMYLIVFGVQMMSISSGNISFVGNDYR